MEIKLQLVVQWHYNQSLCMCRKKLSFQSFKIQMAFSRYFENRPLESWYLASVTCQRGDSDLYSVKYKTISLFPFWSRQTQALGQSTTTRVHDRLRVDCSQTDFNIKSSPSLPLFFFFINTINIALIFWDTDGVMHYETKMPLLDCMKAQEENKVKR